MKLTSVFLVTALFMSVFSNPAEAKKLKVVTTLPSLASITRSIGGDLIEVTSITKGAQDAHYVEAKPSYMVLLNRADLLIYSGLELEIGWLPLLIQGARNSQIAVGAKGSLNASTAVPLESILEKPRGEVDRSMGDVHPSGNPHFLLHPANSILVAQSITDKLSELDAAHAPDYQRNMDSFKATVQEKLSVLESKSAAIRGKEVVCYHPDWSYLLHWLQLDVAGYIELRPGIPPTPKHKREIIDLLQQRNIDVILISTWKEPTIAKEVANIVGARLVILPGEVQATPGIDDYITWIESMVFQIIAAFETK